MWESIINLDPDFKSSDLLRLKGAAAQVGQAWNLVARYEIPLESAQFVWTPETEIFYRWARRYKQRLGEWRALDAATLPRRFIEPAAEKKFPLPDSIIFYGFRRPYPQLQSLASFLKKQNVKIQFVPAPPQDISGSPDSKKRNDEDFGVREFKDAREECVQCSRWVRNEYGSGKTIGVAVCDLPTYAPLLQKELSAELVPRSVYPWEEFDLPFNSSHGEALSQEPAVHLALALLSANNETVSSYLASTILNTPFLSGAEREKEKRNQIDLALKKEGLVSIPLSKIRELAKKNACARLESILDSWKIFIRFPGGGSLHYWTHEISRFLKSLGWPWDSNTGAKQTYVKNIYRVWTQCLDGFASLDNLYGNVGRTQAVDLLSELARDNVFQPERECKDVQVVNLDETYGLKFDRLWILGCHADALPSMPEPNPFIPFHLQQSLNIPRSSALWELEKSENLLDWILESSSGAVFSYPAWDSNSKFLASPLLKKLGPPERNRLITASNKLVDKISGSAELETWNDGAHIVLLEEERRQIAERKLPGGHKLLQNQTQCPFLAFAHHRLGAIKREAPEIDFENRQRGTLVHKVLDLFWKQTKSRANLELLTNDDQLAAKIRECIDQAQRSFADVLAGQKEFAALENERIFDLATTWLTRELERPDFEAVECEYQIDVNVGGIELVLKIDRMDKTEDGLTVLLDYKTGSTLTQKDWFQSRLQEVQLPLYNYQIRPHLAAIAHIQKEESKSRFLFFGDPASTLPGTQINYQEKCKGMTFIELTEHWNEQVISLAEEFKTGVLNVDPFNYFKTCETCDLQTLCRVEERKLALRGVMEEKE